MKATPFVATALLLTGYLGAKDPEAPRSSTLPGKYPAIIQLNPVDPAAPATSAILHSEVGGREIEFLQSGRRYAAELLALAELVKGRDGSEQVKSVAEMLASMQATETEQLNQLAASRKLPAVSVNTASFKTEFAALNGARFEKAWVERLIAVTEASGRAYDVGAKSSDAEIRLFVDKMLPVVKARLQMANRLGGRSVAAPSPSPAPVGARPAAASADQTAKAPAQPGSIPPPVNSAR